jgi:beta-lactamase superfamily II metal-dependent hydrolase
MNKNPAPCHPVRTCIVLLLVFSLLVSGCTDLPGTSFDPGTTGNLRAYFLDVGQGDASVILVNDKVILIDAGEIEAGDRVVSDLQQLGVTRIDLLVATHPHSDHIGGMQKVLAAFPVGEVLDSGTPSTSVLYERFLETIERRGIPYRVAEQGRTIDPDPALRILILSPPKERTSDDLNTNSIVLRISYGTVNLLYTGDATSAAESALLRSGYPLDAQILKVGHHGSSGSSSAAFLSRVRPEIAVLSLGEDNPYGHPHPEAMGRLFTAGPAIYRTDRDGTILVRSNGQTFSVITENAGENMGFSPLADSTPDPRVPVPVTIPTIPENITIPVFTVTLPQIQIGNAASVRISAVQFDAPGDDRQNLNGEWVRLTNTGNSTVLLAGWTLSDRKATDPYIFPAFLLLPETSVTVHVGSGTMNGTALYMGKKVPIFSNSGDEAILRDGSGTIIATRSEN